MTRLTSGFPSSRPPIPRATSTSRRAAGSAHRSARSAGVVRRRSPAARCRITSTRRAPSSGPPHMLRGGTDPLAARERALHRGERLPHLDPLEAVEARALVTVARPAPDLLREELMSVLGGIGKPDFGNRRTENPHRRHAEGGA